MTDASPPPPEDPPQPEATPPVPKAAKRPRYSDSASSSAAAPAKEPFAFQAAKIAIWAPFIAMGIGFVSNGVMAANSKNGAGSSDTTRYANYIFLGINLLLLLSSVALGSYALWSIRRLGAKGLLFRSMVGLLISLTILGFGVYSIYLVRSMPQTMARRVTGEWDTTMRSGAVSAKVHLSLRPDGTGVWKAAGSPGVELPGRWRVIFRTQGSPSLLVFKFDKPIEKPVRSEGFQWELAHVSDNQLELTSAGEGGSLISTVYQRSK